MIFYLQILLVNISLKKGNTNEINCSNFKKNFVKIKGTLVKPVSNTDIRFQFIKINKHIPIFINNYFLFEKKHVLLLSTEILRESISYHLVSIS